MQRELAQQPGARRRLCRQSLQRADDPRRLQSGASEQSGREPDASSSAGPSRASISSRCPGAADSPTITRLQAKLEKRYSAGIYLLNSFTWSKTIDNASGHLEAFNGDNSRVNFRNVPAEKGARRVRPAIQQHHQRGLGTSVRQGPPLGQRAPPALSTASSADGDSPASTR